MSAQDLRLISRGAINALDGITTENINIGSLQRIADATEQMAKNHLQLQADAERWKNSFGAELAENDLLRNRITALHRSISSYKGQITKLKKLLK